MFTYRCVCIGVHSDSCNGSAGKTYSQFTRAVAFNIDLNTTFDLTRLAGLKRYISHKTKLRMKLRQMSSNKIHETRNKSTNVNTSKTVRT